MSNLSKKEKILKASEIVNEAKEFENNLYDLTKLASYELPPSLAYGKLYDMYCEEFLTEDGVDILNGFMFDVFDHNKDNPLIIYEGENEIRLTSLSEVCDYLEKNYYFK